MSIAEFLQRSVVCENRALIDPDFRIILLRESCRFKDFEKLKISLDFASFYDNSYFLFKFFDEIMNEKVTFSSLKFADNYEEFDIHMDILQEILSNYISLLNKHNLYDKLLLPSLSKINRSFLLEFEEINIYLDGYLTKYEFDLLLDISKIVNIKIFYTTSSF